MANVGDTRAVLVGSESVKRISYDHRGIDDGEAERIRYIFSINVIENKAGWWKVEEWVLD